MNDMAAESSAMRLEDYGGGPVNDGESMLLALPHSIEAEQAVLGGLLLHPSALEGITDLIALADFFHHTHRTIFDAIGAVAETGGLVDMLIVGEQLRTVGELEAIGGHGYLITLTQSVVSASGIRNYAAIVREKARLRALIAAADAIRSSAYGAAHDAQTAAEQAVALLEGIARIDGTQRQPKPQPLNLRDLAARRAPPRVWLRPGWLADDPLLLAGAGGSGKSTLIVHEAIAGALGRPYFAPACEPYGSLVWNCEDKADDLWRTAERVCDHERLDMAELDGRVHLVSRYGYDNALMAETRRGVLEATRLLRELREQVNDLHIRMIWLDNVAHVMLGNHDDRTQVTQFINALVGLVVGRPFGVGLAGHLSRGQGSEFSGSVAWENAVRMRWFLGSKLPDQVGADDAATDSKVRFLAKRKTNHSPRDYVRMEMRNGLLVPETAPVGHVAGVMTAMDEQRAEQLCVAGFRSLCDMGIRTTDGKTTADYLPSQIVAKGLAAGYSKTDLGQAMNRLMGKKVFVRGVVGKHPNRSEKYGLIFNDASV